MPFCYYFKHTDCFIKCSYPRTDSDLHELVTKRQLASKVMYCILYIQTLPFLRFLNLSLLSHLYRVLKLTDLKTTVRPSTN